MGFSRKAVLLLSKNLPGLLVLTILAFPGLAAQAQAPTPGDILVTGSNSNSQPSVREYTPDGTLIRELNVPYPGTNMNEASTLRDVVVDGAGNICVFHGTFSPYLSVYSPTTHAWTQMTYPGWDIANNGTYGCLAAFGTSVFATDIATSGSGSPNGLIRFNTATRNAHRFASGTDYISVTLGKDGLLYALSGSGSPSGNGIDVFNPATLAKVRSLAVPEVVGDSTESATRSIAVNSQGQIFLNGLYGPVYRLASGGAVLGSSDYNQASYMDNVDIDGNGQVLLTQADGTIFLTDEAFHSFRTLSTFGNNTYNSFAKFVPAAAPMWSAASVSVGMDGFTRLLWNRSDGVVPVWNVDASGQIVTQQYYGPYAGWTATAIATGKDNNTRLLWTNTDGTASVYLLNSADQKIRQVQYGPYSGWTAKTLAVAPDNTVRLLWTNTSGAASVYRLNATNGYVSYRSYGPYNGWTAKSVTVGADGLTHLLWTNTNGTATLWRLNAQGTLQDQQQYGPYDGWTAQSVASASDGTFRLVWQNTDGHIALWTLNTEDQMIGQSQYGPYDGWSEISLAVGVDGKVHLLLDNVSGQAALWNLDPGGSFVANFLYGPY